MLALHASSQATFTIPLHDKLPVGERTVFIAKPATAREAIRREELIAKALAESSTLPEQLAALVDAIAINVVEPLPHTLAESHTCEELWEILYGAITATRLTAASKGNDHDRDAE